MPAEQTTQTVEHEVHQNTAALTIERDRYRALAAAQAMRLALIGTITDALTAPTSVQALCDRLVETIHMATGYYIAEVYLRRGGHLHMAAFHVPDRAPPIDARSIALGAGIVGYVAATNQPYLCHDTRGDPHFHQPPGMNRSRSEIAVPMSIGGEAIGVINVEHVIPNAFSDEDVATLIVIAGQAAMGVRNAQLYEAEAEERRRTAIRAQRLEQIHHVTKKLKLDLDEREIGMHIVNAARETLGFRMAVLNIFARPGDPASRARVIATAGLPPEGIAALQATDFSLGATEDLLQPEFLIAHSYFIPAESMKAGNALEVPTWTPAIANSGEDAWQAGDELLVPLIDHQGGSLIGFLSVDDPESGRRPDLEEVEVLEIFVDQAVIALRNTHLLAQSRRQAERDTVTDLLNHRAIHMRLEAALSGALAQEKPLGLLAIDMDDFKLINDTHGHAVGDMALRHIARILERCVRGGDMLARLGGDEFLVILAGAGWQQSVDVMERIIAIIHESPLHIDGVGDVPLRLSGGVAACPEDAVQPHALLMIADTRLYEAKRAGGRTVETGKRSAESVRRTGERESRDLDGFDMLSSLVHAVDNKDRYTREHSEQVAAIACTLADVLGLSVASQRTLRIAGLLHDVGKIGVPDRILRKPGPLDASEWDAMRQHVVLSTALIRAIDLDPDVLSAVAQHHERWDGKGYPAGIAGADLSLLGRIMIAADGISAMALDRPYRKGLPAATIVKELRKGAGTQFDPDLVEPAVTIVERLLEGRHTG